MHARIHFPFFQRRPANARSWLTFCAAVPLLITLAAGTATAAATPPAAPAGSRRHHRLERDHRRYLVGRHDQAAGRGRPLHGVCPGGRLQRRGRHPGTLRALPVPRPRTPRRLGPGGRGRRRPRDPGDLRPVRAGHPGRRLRRVAGQASRRHGEDPRHRVRHPRRRQPDPAARPRRPQRPHLLHPAAGTGGLAAHPASVPADVGAVARLRDAAAGAQRHPVRPAGPARAHLGPLHPRLQRGQGPGFAHLDTSGRRRRRAPRRSSPATPWCSTTPRCGTR